MRLYNAIVFTAVALIPGLAHSACTQQDATAKGARLSQMVQAKMAKDPAAGQAMMMKMQPIMKASQEQIMSGGAIDWNAVCSQFDAMAEEAK